ncbi:hypothetical protein N8I77_002422 [Diaporthe amygdali]|uniref:Uncharacterized protein n=1 Tax=Phomopsis amygdali TaxID=1214568 RepID=A0AAD9SU05_PHOAM|nr:hypothetical protein N8I77_002422 [Diaporthe amygdali]
MSALAANDWPSISGGACRGACYRDHGINDDESVNRTHTDLSFSRYEIRQAWPVSTRIWTQILQILVGILAVGSECSPRFGSPGGSSPLLALLAGGSKGYDV